MGKKKNYVHRIKQKTILNYYSVKKKVKVDNNAAKISPSIVIISDSEEEIVDEKRKAENPAAKLPSIVCVSDTNKASSVESESWLNDVGSQQLMTSFVDERMKVTLLKRCKSPVKLLAKKFKVAEDNHFHYKETCESDPELINTNRTTGETLLDTTSKSNKNKFRFQFSKKKMLTDPSDKTVAEVRNSRPNGRQESFKDGIKTYVSKEVKTDMTHDNGEGLTPISTAIDNITQYSFKTVDLSVVALSEINIISRNESNIAQTAKTNEKVDVDSEGNKVCLSVSSNSLNKTAIYPSNKEISAFSVSSNSLHKGSSSDQSKTGSENLLNVLNRISSSSALKTQSYASHSSILKELKTHQIELLNSYCDVLNSIPNDKLKLIFGEKSVDFLKLKELNSKVNSKIKLLEGNRPNQGAEDTSTATSSIIGESLSKSAYITNTSDMLHNKIDLNVPQQKSSFDSSGKNVSILQATKLVAPQQKSLFYLFYGKENIVSIKNIQETKKSQTIRGRVTIKSDKHSFTNKRGWAKGQGIMFSINVLDQTCEIQMTAFDNCVDQFFDLIEVDKIYTFSNFTVKNSDKQKASIHNFHLRFTKNTRLVPSRGSDIPELGFNFKSIASVNRKNKNKMVDILAICERYGQLLPVTLISGESGRARELFLVDYTGEIMVTIWGSNADNFDHAPGCVIAFKRARVTHWKGGSLDVSCLSNSTFKVNPDTDEAHALTKWYVEKNT